MKNVNPKTSNFSAYFLCLLSILFFAGGCNNDNKNAEKTKIIDEYHKFITQLENDSASYSDDYWQQMELRFNAVDSTANNYYPALENSQQKRIDSLRMKYSGIKESYREKKEINKQINELREQNDAFRKKLLTRQNEKNKQQKNTGTEIPELTEDITKINNENIANYFENFLENVKENKDNYTTVEWDMVKSIYEELSIKKNEAENIAEGISSKDNNRIAKVKLEYAAIRIPGRIESKVREKRKEGKPF